MRKLLFLFVAASLLLVAAPALADDMPAKEDRCYSDCQCEPGKLCRPPGVCEPVLCPQIYLPVCGLDGETYGNACEAEAAHVVIAHEGECGKTCGGIQGKPCPDKGQICDLDPGMCKTMDATGTCKERPEICTKEYKPVCGCNGRTYGNDCMRLAAGAQKAHDGACEDPPTKKGRKCTSDDECSNEQFCNYPLGRCDGEGACLQKPEICPFLFDPVCGCDGITYSNACHAAAAGVSIRCDASCSECS